MNFLKSVLFDDDDEEDELEVEVEKQNVKLDEENKPLVEKSQGSEVDSEIKEEEADALKDVDEADSDGDGDLSALVEGFSGWGFGNIVKSIKEKSEEIFNEYKEELHEFHEGLKRETEELVEITGHKVKDLPSSLESGAQVAQESLEDVGQTIEEIGTSLWKGTREIISQVREAVALVEEEAAMNARGKPIGASRVASIQKGKYSRYEAQVSAMQRDSSTYCDEPDDTEEFSAWKEKSFSLEERKQEIDGILKDNAFMQELQSRIVPTIVEHETFWCRYFYRLHKLQQAEDARADLVKRAARTEEEELSWDVDEDADSPSTKKPTSGKGSDGAAIVQSNETKGFDVKEDSAVPASGKVEFSANDTPKPTDPKLDPVMESPEKSVQSDVTKVELPDVQQPVTAEVHDEEIGSDANSSSSEWQVVSQGGSPRNDEEERTKNKSSVLPVDCVSKKEEITAIKETSQGTEVDKKLQETEVKEEDNEKGQEEDWSEWE